jgi:hypothetical protein
MRWTLEKVAELSTDALQRLRANAISHPDMAGAEEALSFCDQVLAGRAIKVAKAGRTKRPGGERNAEAEAVAKLTSFAKILLAKYDLSPATAKRLSQGVKGFRALELLGKSGNAKVGGLQINGSLSIDRYISYRLAHDQISLAFVLLKDRPVEQARWMIAAPRRLLPEATSVIEQFTGLGEVPKEYGLVSGLIFDDFEQAAFEFSSIIARLFE